MELQRKQQQQRASKIENKQTLIDYSKWQKQHEKTRTHWDKCIVCNVEIELMEFLDDLNTLGQKCKRKKQMANFSFFRCVSISLTVGVNTKRTNHTKPFLLMTQKECAHCISYFNVFVSTFVFLLIEFISYFSRFIVETFEFYAAKWQVDLKFITCNWIELLGSIVLRWKMKNGWVVSFFVACHRTYLTLQRTQTHRRKSKMHKYAAQWTSFFS